MKQQSVHSPDSQQDESPHFPWLLTLIGVAGVLMILQVTGIFKTVDTQHQATVIDTRSKEYESRQIPKERIEHLKKATPEVDNVLSAIKEEYESPVFTDIRTANENNNWGLTDDEAKFYDDMRARYGGTRDNWLGVVQRANQTYKSVKEIFGGDSNVSEVLRYSRTSAIIYARINQRFGIPALDCLNFAQSGRATRLSDWANFVETHKNKE